MRLLLVLCLGWMGFSSVEAATSIKIAFLAPEGTTWASTIKTMFKEVEKATNKSVTFKIYFGGVSGDEPDMLRKIRAGQLQGSVFTGRTLGELCGDVRAIELPFNFFNDRSLMNLALTKLKPRFNACLEKQGMKSVGYFDIGPVYIVSKKKAVNLDQLRGVKIWAWEGDVLVKTMVDVFGMVSIPLSLPDVLSSLSTGVIDAAYASPAAIIGLQWHSKIKFLIDYPVAYSISSLLIDMKTWNALTPAEQKAISEITTKYASQSNESTAKENAEALSTMKGMGVEFIEFPQTDMAKAVKLRQDVVARLKNKLISSDVIQQLDSIIKK